MSFSPLDSNLVGPLFADAAMRAVFCDRARLAAMLRAEWGLAVALEANGLAPASLAPALAKISVDDFDIAALGAATQLAGVPVIPFVKAAQKMLPLEAESAFHKGATTQDIEDTAQALMMRAAFALIARDGADILQALRVLAARYRAAPCAGRTYGQHAAPITLGAKFGQWGAGLADVLTRLRAVEARACVASLGGPVGLRAAYGAKADAVNASFAASLELGAEPVVGHVRRARIVDVGCFLGQLIGALAKMASDVAYLCSTEVREVAEPFTPGRGGSSAMPHKRNPVSCTIILAAQTAAPGLVAALLAAAPMQHERPVGLWHGEWHGLTQLFGLASGALREARLLARGLEVDVARAAENLDATQGLLFSDALVGALSPALGREKAYGLVEEKSAQARAQRLHLRDLAPDDPALAQRWRSAFDLSGAIEAGAHVADCACRLMQTCENELSAAEKP